MARKKTDYICPECRRCDKEKMTHPGVRHLPGICDCECRDE